METKVTKDGFVWLVVPDNYAMEMWKANLATLYVLHNDDSETMVETDLQMADAICMTESELALRLDSSKACSRPVPNAAVGWCQVETLNMNGSV